MSEQQDSAFAPLTVLSTKRRKAGEGLVSSTLSAGAQIGLRSFTRDHLGFRLGIFWVVLDPLLRAMVFSFLMIVIRGNASAESLVIGVFTLTALNQPFSSSMNIRLSEEPFPLSHTPTFPLIISKLTSDIMTSVFLGLSGAMILLLALDLPIELLAALPIACSSLTVIGCGAGLLLSPYVTVVKDLSKFVRYVLLLSLFLQCVLYPYSVTVGTHRLVLYWLPHTIVVEWCRAVASNGSFPFSIEHSIIVLAIWSVPMLYGFIRYDHYRWRSTTWS